MNFHRTFLSYTATILVVLLIFTSQTLAQEDAIAARALPKEELAKKLQNPVAALISVPFQLNYDQNIGLEDDGYRWTLNIQPVIPFSLNEDWNLISRTILPVIHQDEIFPGAGDQTGIGDVVQSVFFSPKKPTKSGWIWGAGPVFLLPTGSDDLLTTDKWGAGPTAVALRQQGPWTYGALANHIWSFAGDGDRADVNATFLQPFVAYTTPTAWTFTLNSESTYDWEIEDWSVPINMVISKVTNIGGQLVSVAGGARYWAESPDNGPEGWGARLVFTLLFPK
ncbi:MAG: transporter [Deltaproteobacteria bacterium]|nr:transporter [Deltaproteobacteria bacterium]